MRRSRDWKSNLFDPLLAHLDAAGVGSASIFFTGIVGGAIAIGQYLLAIGSAIVLLLTLRLVGAIEKRLF